MAFDFAATKALVRQVVQDTMAVPGLYQDGSLEEPVELRVRFHTKIHRVGDMIDQGWAEVVEGVNRLILNKAELDEKDVLPVRGGTVTLTPPGYESIVLVLHLREPDSGPTEVVWQVSLQ